ncbi:MAG: T9SS type A sorting domain-containing protein [bacterium]|nr:T9SS type A sorting domain-containing protein [bacterium]
MSNQVHLSHTSARPLKDFTVVLFSIILISLLSSYSLVLGSDLLGNAEGTASQSLDAPTLVNCPPSLLFGFVCNDIEWDLDAIPTPGCETLTWSAVAVDVQPAGAFSIDENGVFTVAFDIVDGGNLFRFLIIVTDNCGAADSCIIMTELLSGVPSLLKIASVNGQYGDRVEVPITYHGAELMQRFDFAINFNPDILNFLSVDLGSSLGSSGCQWEYFNYSYSLDGPPVESGPTAVLRISAIADINNGEIYPACNYVSSGDALVTMNFSIAHNHWYDCQFLPIRFVWNNCLDNSIKTLYPDIHNTSCRVYDYGNTDPIVDPNYELTNIDCDNEWRFGGSCGQCEGVPDLWNRNFVNFWNGGIDLLCADSFCVRGDMNVNRIAYEVGDFVVYSNYFLYGLPALTIFPPLQICGSDINDDGYTLTVADIVHMMRIMSGEIMPLVPKSAQSAVALLTVENGTIVLNSNADIGGILLELQSPASEQIVINNLAEFEMMQAAKTDNITRVLLLPRLGSRDAQLNSGTVALLNTAPGTKILSAEIADYYGNPIAVELSKSSLPTEFSLDQNTPNPFNPTTRININLPTLSDWILSIINVSGQVVETFTGTGIGIVGVDWNARSYPSGVYFYRATVGNYTETRKMVLLK